MALLGHWLIYSMIHGLAHGVDTQMKTNIQDEATIGLKGLNPVIEQSRHTVVESELGCN